MITKEKISDVNEIWNNWANSPSCDYMSFENFYAIQMIVFKTIVETGECIIRRRYVKPSENNILGFELQVLGPEFLDHNYNEDLIHQTPKLGRWGTVRIIHNYRIHK